MPGGQAEYLRVPQAHFGPIKVPEGPPDERFVFLSDVLPTAWQAVEYAAIPDGGSLAVFGLGPIGEMSSRIALHRGASEVFGVDLVPERLDDGPPARRARHRPARARNDLAEALRALTDGRGPDSVDRRGRDGGARGAVRASWRTRSPACCRRGGRRR